MDFSIKYNITDKQMYTIGMQIIITFPKIVYCFAHVILI